ncbi:hypothetical protein D3C86_2238410 [compost metagenome]
MRQLVVQGCLLIGRLVSRLRFRRGGHGVATPGGAGQADDNGGEELVLVHVFLPGGDKHVCLA